MRHKDCTRCGARVYWAALEDEPAPCCYAPDEPPVEHEEPDYDYEDEAEFARYMSPVNQIARALRRRR